MPRTYCVDWISVSFPDGVSYRRLEPLFEAPASAWARSAGGHWAEVWRLAPGCRIEADGCAQVRLVSVSGSGCMSLGGARVMELGRLGRVTRLDLAWDDRDRILEPGDLWRLLQAGLKVGRVRSWRRIESVGTRGGETVYVGAPASEVQLRCYDKTAESCGSIEGIRWELQLRDGRAREAFRAVDRGEVDFSALVLGFLDFRRGGRRGPRVASWSALWGSGAGWSRGEAVEVSGLEEYLDAAAEQIAGRLWLLAQLRPAWVEGIVRGPGDSRSRALLEKLRGLK